MSNNDLKCPKCDKQHHPAESCNFVHTDMPETTITTVCTGCLEKDAEIAELKRQLEKAVVMLSNGNQCDLVCNGESKADCGGKTCRERIMDYIRDVAQ